MQHIFCKSFRTVGPSLFKAFQPDIWCLYVTDHTNKASSKQCRLGNSNKGLISFEFVNGTVAKVGKTAVQALNLGNQVTYKIGPQHSPQGTNVAKVMCIHSVSLPSAQ